WPPRQRGRALGQRAAAALLPHHGARSARPAGVEPRLDRHARLRRFGAARIANVAIMTPNEKHGLPWRNDMSTATPSSIAEYLDQLRSALGDADPALIQDALYDAEEHLRGEM